MTDFALALDRLGFGSYQFGPDLSTYQRLAAGWPEQNPALPSEADLEAAAAAWARAARVADVKAEARRRIVAIADPDRQRNLTARGTEFALKLAAGETLTADEQAELAAGEAIWTRIKALRTASNNIEAMDPIPADFADNTYWPE